MPPSKHATLFNLRDQTNLPPGRCVYIQSGDTTDFDGYLCAAHAERLVKDTPDLVSVNVVARRRATPDRTADRNVHDPDFSNECMQIGYNLLHAVSPSTRYIEGPLNEENFIPNKFIAHERTKYSNSLVAQYGTDEIASLPPAKYEQLDDLVQLIDDETTTSVVLDVLGGVGFLEHLITHSKTFIQKLKASTLPVVSMNGILAEQEIKTMVMPGRDRRATMNNLYSRPTQFMTAVKEHSLPIVYSTNTATTAAYCYEDGNALVKGLGLTGLLRQLAIDWFGPHLQGKYVPFDYVTILSRIAYGRDKSLVEVEKRALYVGTENASVQVLVSIADHEKDPADRPDLVKEALGEDTAFYGIVESVSRVDSAAGETLSHEILGEENT